MAVAAVVCVITANVQASTITYSLVNNAAYQNGLTLSGSITTDGTIGALGKGNITAWSWALTDGSGTVVGSSAGASPEDSDNVTATAYEILLPQIGGYFSLMLGDYDKYLKWSGDPPIELSPSDTYPATRNYLAADNLAQQFWINNQSNPALTSTSSGQWIVAQAIPEPTSALMSALGAIMLLRRRRK